MSDSETKSNGSGDSESHHHPDEAEIDEALKESFPASDPPAWTMGIEADEPEGNSEDEDNER